jgi:threonine-phosphate decarboxylase
MSVEYTHGGDIARAAWEVGVAVRDILDFSANVNPAGLPRRARERLAREAMDPLAWSRYPDPELSGLRQAISRYAGVPPACIVIGAGADSLIHAVVRALLPQRCVIPIPAFSEYQRAASAFGCRSIEVPLDSDFDPCAGDLLFLNNPHNPTGACVHRSDMLDRINIALASGAMVLVDEAFIDYAPGASITADATQLDGVVCIRSLTKFFGCPGLRVGYAVAAPQTSASLQAQLPPWPVTTLAANALAEALVDTAYIQHTLERNTRARSSLESALAALGIQALPSAANFLLLRLPEDASASVVRDRLLGDHAMLVRECNSFAGLEHDRYLRIAVRTEDENARLMEALEAVLKSTRCLPTHA